MRRAPAAGCASTRCRPCSRPRSSATCSASIVAPSRKAAARIRGAEQPVTFSGGRRARWRDAGKVAGASRGGDALLRVLICDDHTLVRAGLRRLLESFADIEVVAEASSADEAVLRTRESLPHIVLLDLSMPGRSGFDALAELRQTCPD